MHNLFWSHTIHQHKHLRVVLSFSVFETSLVCMSLPRITYTVQLLWFCARLVKWVSVNAQGERRAAQTFWQYAQDSRRYEFVMINKGMEHSEGYQYWDIYFCLNCHSKMLFKHWQWWYSYVLALNRFVAFAQLPLTFLGLQAFYPRGCHFFFIRVSHQCLLTLSFLIPHLLVYSFQSL